MKGDEVLPLLLVVVLLPVGAMAWLAFSVRRGPSRRALKGPVCGVCGYNVLGLATMTCPECGSDLRIAGILTPRTPRQGAWGLVDAFGFTLLFGFVAVVATFALMAVLPMRRSYTQQVRLVTPASRAYQEVVLRAETAMWGMGAPALPIEIELVPNVPPSPATLPPTTQPTRLSVRPNGYEFASRGAAGSAARVSRPGGFGSAAVLEWMKANGIDTTLPAVQEEAARIAGEARLVARGRWRLISGAGPGGYSSSSAGSDSGDQFTSRYSTEQADRRQPASAVILFVLFWIAEWIAGLRHLARRAVPTPGRPAQDRRVPV